MSKMNQAIFDRILSVTSFSKNTGEMLYHLPEVENFSISVTTTEDDVVDATGSPIAVIQSAKQAEFSGEASFINFGLYAAQNGTEIKESSNTQTQIFPRMEKIVVISDGAGGAKALLSKKAVAGVDGLIGVAGNEIDYIYTVNPDGTKKDTLKQAATFVQGTSDPNEFSYTYTDAVAAHDDVPAVPATSVIACDVSLVGKEIMVFYNYENTNGQLIDNMSNNFSDPSILIVRGLVRDTCNAGLVDVMCIKSDNATLSNAFDMTLARTEKQPFKFRVLPSYCSGKKLFTTYIPDTDETENI